MNLSATEIQQLYIAYYNRPAEPGGFKYWSGVAATQDAVAAAFGASPEYQAAYQGMSSKDIVKTLYHNLFGRTGDTDGVSYWSALMDQGALKTADVALALVRGAQGADAQVLANKAQLAQEWTVKATALAGDLPTTLIRNPGLMSDWLAQVTDGDSLAAARANIDSAVNGAVGTDMATSLAISGQVQATGYLQHATVFIDANNNGVLDTGELHTETDSHGHYLLISSGTQDFPLPSGFQPSDHLVVTGGVDASTGRVNTDTLSATVYPPLDHGYLKNASLHAAITPLSTLRDALVANGMTQAAAEAKLAAAFGIDAGAVGADTLAAVFDADAGQQAAALHAQAVNVQVGGVLAMVGSTLQLLGNPTYAGLFASSSHTTPPPPWLSRGEAQKVVIDSMASAIANQHGAYALDQASTIQSLLASAAAKAPAATNVKAGLDAASAASLSAFDTIVAGAAGAVMQNTSAGIGSYTALAHIAQSGAAMTSIADALPIHLKQNSAADLLPKFTGDALKALTALETLLDIDPYSHADDAAIAATSGPAPATSKLAVEQLYVTLLGRPAEPAELQSGMKLDAATVASTLASSYDYKVQSMGKVPAQQVDNLYSHAFGHSADAAGLAYWVDLLNNQKIDIAGIARYVALGAAGSDAITLLNRSVAATEFTTAISAMGIENDYIGPAAHAMATGWLNTVTDTTSVADAIAAIYPEISNIALPEIPHAGLTDPHGWLL